MTQSRFIVFLLLFVLAWFAGLDDRSLTRPDEGRYAEIPREMAVSGNWVTPRLNGLKYFEKPPLQYWATALAYDTLGQHNWTARLWPALTGLFGLLLIYAISRRLYDARTALAATAILASTLWYFAIAHINTLDMGLTAWMTLTLAGFLFAERPGATRGERSAGMHAAWVGMALAVLSKGLIGIVLPGGVLFIYSVWQRDLRLWDRLHIGTGLLLFFAIVTPWFYLVQAQIRNSRILLFPRASGALHFHRAPAHGRVVVLRSRPAGRTRALDAAVLVPAPSHPSEWPRRRPFTRNGCWSSGACSSSCSSASRGRSCRPISCRSFRPSHC